MQQVDVTVQRGVCVYVCVYKTESVSESDFLLVQDAVALHAADKYVNTSYMQSINTQMCVTRLVRGFGTQALCEFEEE